MIPIARPLLGKEEQRAVMEVLNSEMIACGPKVEQFEHQFAKFVGTKYAVATTSGTTALHLALSSIGIKKKDEVIVPSFSFIATANSVLFCDAIPIFCDIDYKTFNINSEKIESLITKSTKAIMPVHLYGQPANINPILETAGKYGISVVGDAAQAHGAMYENKMIGCFGNVECFSFYPTKNMTTGEGGMITTDDKEIAERAISLRNHGRDKTRLGYEHCLLGYNYRMNDISAAIGIEQLKKLPKFNNKRRENAKYFDDEIEGVDTPFVLDNAKHVYHQYTIKTKEREAVIQKLKNNDVGYGIYYPKPLHFYPHLKRFSHNDLKVSEKISQEVLSIPVHPALTHKELEKVTKCF